jgi:2-hydroxyacyl-CoA lyase 1
MQGVMPDNHPLSVGAARSHALQNADVVDDDAAPANYYRALRDVADWAPEDAIIIGEGASTMDIGRTQLPNVKARHRLDAGSYGTMGVGMGEPARTRYL